MSTQDSSTFRSIIPFVKRAIHNQVQETVNARALHANLGIGKDFTSWIKVQIKRAYLIENENFITFTQKGERKDGQRGATWLLVSL